MKRFIGWLIEHITDSRDWFYYAFDKQDYKVIVINDQMPHQWKAIKLGNRIFTVDRNFSAIKYACVFGVCRSNSR